MGTGVTGSYGSITINADGSYSYTVDNSNSAVQALRTTSNTLQDVFTYQVTDTAGLTSLATITVTIQGANDAPVGVNDTATAMEAGGVANGTAGTNPTGNVLTNDTDVDSGDTKTVSGVVAGPSASAVGSVGTGVTGSYGSITINADGSYSYTVDNSNSAVQALRTSGNTLQDVFTYQVVDTAGLTSLATITVTIQGANDAPVATADTTNALEAGGVNNGTAGTSPSGNVLTNDSDVDSSANGETRTVTGVAAGVVGSTSGAVGTAVTGSYGMLTLQANGLYSYTVDNSNATVQALANVSQSIQDVFTYTITDAGGLTSTTQVTVIIQGANDTPTISSNGGGATASISMAENITAVTTVVGSDVDAGTTLTYTIVGGADAAKFTITAGGSLTFVTAPDFEAPSDVGGNNIYDVIVEVSDGSLATTQALAVTITDVSNFLVVTTDVDNNDSGI